MISLQKYVLLISLLFYGVLGISQSIEKNTSDTLNQKDFLDFNYPNPIQYKKKNTSFTVNAFADICYVAGVKNSRDSVVQGNMNNNPITDSVYKMTYPGLRDYTSFPQYANTFSMPYSYLQTTFEVENKFRTRIALHAGHIVESLYGEELQGLRMIREASILYHFNQKLNLEVGILPSYYGFEVMASRENMNVTRAYIADYAPDYEMGARLSYSFSKYFTAKLLVYNGWQEIADLNGKKSIGLFLNYVKENKIYFHYANYYGDCAPIGFPRQRRHYSNMVGKVWLGKRWILASALDHSIQEKTNGKGLEQFFAPAISIRYKISNQYGACVRWDNIRDKNSIIPELYTGKIYGWQSDSYTLTLEYIPNPVIMFRAEGRFTHNKGNVFRGKNNTPTNIDMYALLSMSFLF